MFGLAFVGRLHFMEFEYAHVYTPVILRGDAALV